MGSIFGDEERFFKDLSADPVELEKYISQLNNKVVDPNEPSFNGFDEEFCFMDFHSASADEKADLSEMYKSASLLMNRIKNRYSNVLPKEHSRVKLKVLSSEEGDDYINANYIDGLIPGSEKEYISTQGPLIATFADFWRMIWEQKACVIVMLTKEIENDRPKCDRYWPDYDMPLTTEHHTVKLVDAHETEELTERKLLLLDTKSGESRTVWQFQYTAWPDHDLPTTANPMGAFLDLAHKVDKVNTTKGPLVIHCSAGIGRSGTFCAVHSIIEKMRYDLKSSPDQTPHFSILKTILDMRSSRPGMVQTKDQYMFCYLTLLEESRRLLGKNGEVGEEHTHSDRCCSIDSTTTEEEEDETTSDVEDLKSSNFSDVVLQDPKSQSSSNATLNSQKDGKAKKTEEQVEDSSESRTGGIWDLANNLQHDRVVLQPDLTEVAVEVDGLAKKLDGLN